ncbi:beta-glucosidase-domain-containing protein [Xylaria arbuscula]|nr:beta-glucosidase-domain-containing protein [Xylaria arbuscula]
MKTTILNLAVAASLGSVAVAQPHRHGHHAHHHKRDNSPLEERDVVTTVVPATVTQYMLGDQSVSPEEASAGLDKGLYIVVGETTPTFTPPPAPATTSTSSKEDGVFIEKVTSSSSSSSTSTPTPTPTTTTEPTTTSTAEPEATTSAASYPVSSGATGIDADFPDGELDCTTFPSDYGAVALDYLGLGGWSGLQYTPNYSLKDLAISFIETGIASPKGQKGFYSYACPPGYVKAQWPSSQGNTGQSIGGLYCNDEGKLELTRADVSTKLCEEGVPGITIVNKMSSGTSVCRTDYPGTENMVIPIDATAGSTSDLANVDSSTYYKWQNKPTTLQYYINKKGVSAEKGCVWLCEEDSEGCGNWAPANIGVGKSSDGTTYLSLFPNSPTSDAKLDFKVKFSGDVTEECTYTPSEGFSQSDTGCTAGIRDGGSAVITFYE